ncbi:MAG: hypothetical protein ACR2P7_07415 [bacterium]
MIAQDWDDGGDFFCSFSLPSFPQSLSGNPHLRQQVRQANGLLSFDHGEG